MKTKRGMVAALKEALHAELKAATMYDAHARVIADPEIVQGLRTILEVEEGHARLLASRIEALQSGPVVVELADVPSFSGPIGDQAAIAELLASDLAEEQWAIKHYAATIADFLLAGDDETLAVLEENLLDELRHARWLRDRLRLLAPFD